MDELRTLLGKLEGNEHISSVGVIAYGGSLAYGLADEHSDVDLRGIALPTARDILLMRDFEQVETTDGVDGVIYSLRKAVKLMLACNPNVIELLGLRDNDVLVSSPVYDRLVENKGIFLSRAAAGTFGGYATAQRRRIENKKKKQNDQADVAADARRMSKHASHLIRLMRMGSELLETGEVNTYRAYDRELLLDIKRGGWTAAGADGGPCMSAAFWDLLETEEQRFAYAKENTVLPEKPDGAAAEEIVVEEHRRIIVARGVTVNGQAMARLF